MDTAFLLLLPVAFPIAAAALLRLFSAQSRRRVYGAAALGVQLALVVLCAAAAKGEMRLVQLAPALYLALRLDGVGRVFSLTAAAAWLACGLYSREYMAREEGQGRYYAFLFLTQAAVMLQCFAANYLTMYLGFEAMTLLSVPLVLHERTPAARRGGLRYLFYSVFGACLALAAFFALHLYGRTTDFVPGGVLDMAKAQGHEGFLLTAAFLAVLGFGAKAGMFPLQAWLPAAHPEAPAGASALLSGVITKAGVLCILRVVYYQFGADFLRGSWAQTVWLALALATVFIGSMLACMEPMLKKRLAWSTVSQVSYILFGLALLQPTALCGALLHVVVHCALKCALFFIAGAIILQTGRTDVRTLRGVGRSMPFTMGCFALCALGLVGIPPLGGFVSKWMLAEGALAADIPLFSWLGPAVLLLSALLTARYLLAVVATAFAASAPEAGTADIPTSDTPMAEAPAPDTGAAGAPAPGAPAAKAPAPEAGVRSLEPGLWITLPLAALGAFVVLCGLVPRMLTRAFAAIAGALC